LVLGETRCRFAARPPTCRPPRRGEGFAAGKLKVPQRNCIHTTTASAASIR
jgi:hypothetical protein